jgi:SsrA-binding protein
MSKKIVATNRKAKHEYQLLESFEAGLALQGSEIKSIRAGQISLTQSYVTIERGEAWLVNAHIAPYDEAGRFNHDPVRPRKLLLHRSEIRKLDESIRLKGVTVVPISVYLKEGKAKIEISIARGKKLFDKRAAIAKRDSERDLQRQLGRRE